jgi:hypothetical protein
LIQDIPSAVGAVVFGSDLAERDFDFLILEEAATNADFLLWLLARAGMSASGAEPIRLERSVSTYVGESDLVIVVRQAGQRRALLVENKIAAVFQPAQPERYRKRGEAGRQSGDWEEFTTVLLAPAAYISNSTEAIKFDARISYEELADFYERVPDARGYYRAKLVRAGLKRAKRPWIRTIDPTMTAFFEQVREFALHNVPSLPLPPEAGRGPTSTWLSFRVEGFPARVLIEVKTLKGWSDLRLYQVQQATLQAAFKGKLPSNSTVVGGGRSAAIRLPGPAIDPRQAFEAQKQKVAELLQNADQLYRYAGEHDAVIRQLLDA